MDKSRIDHIHDFVEINDDTWALIQTQPVRAELDRLGQIGQLGLIEQAFPLAKHTKLEHSIGLHHLVGLACEHVQGIGGAEIQKKAILLAAVLHNIGHMPYGLAAERALLSVDPWAPAVSKLIDGWINPVRQQICRDCPDECWRFRQEGNHYALFRWHSAAKILQLTSIDHSTRKETAKYTVCRRDPGYSLLSLLDRTEYTVRDLFYLGMLRVNLNALPFLKAVQLDSDGSVVPTGVSSTIGALSKYLQDNVYNAPGVIAYEQVFAAMIGGAILEGNLDPTQLPAWNDEDLRQWLQTADLRYLGVPQKPSHLLEAVGRGRIVSAVQVWPVNGDGNTPAALEASVAGTRGRNAARASLARGLFIHCQRRPVVTGYGEEEPDTYVVTIICDLRGMKPRYLTSAVAAAEERLFYPEPEEDTRTQLIGFLLGRGCEPKFSRFEDAALSYVLSALRKLGKTRARQLAALRRNDDLLALKRAYFEREDDVPLEDMADDFIRTPGHYTTGFITKVISRLASARAKRRKGEDVEQAKQRKETLHEYRHALRWLLQLRRKARWFWILPGVVIQNEQGRPWREVDVFCVWVPKDETRVRACLVACSTDTSPGKAGDDRDKLGQVAHVLKQRFPRTVAIEAFLNDEKVDLT